MAPLGSASSGGLKPLGGSLGGGSLGGGSLGGGSLGPLGGSKPLGSLGSLALPSVGPSAASAGPLASIGGAAGSPGAAGSLSAKPVGALSVHAGLHVDSFICYSVCVC